jgi:hypothetical protein
VFINEWAGQLALVAKKRNACRILVDRPEGKKSLGKPGRR